MTSPPRGGARAPQLRLPNPVAPGSSGLPAATTATTWLLLVITLLGLALRLFRLGEQSLWIDELLMIRRASLGEPFRFGDWFVNPQGPLPALLLRISAGLFGTTEVSLRLPSALAGAATIPVIGRIAARFDPRAVIPAAVLAALSPFLIWYSQETRHYAVAILGAALAHLTFLRLLEGPAGPRRVAAYAACLWIGLMSNLTVIFMAAAHGLTVVTLRRERWRPWLAAVAPAFLLMGPWIWVAVTANLNLRDVVSVAPVPVAERLRGETTFSWLGVPYTGFVFFAGYSLGPSLVELHDAPRLATVLPHLPGILPLALAAVVLCAVGFLGRETSRTLRWLVLLSVLLPLAAVLALAWRNAKVFNPRYIAVALPLILAVTAAGYSRLRRRSALLAGAVGLLMLLPTLLALKNYYFDPRYARENMRAAADLLKREAGAEDLVLGLGAPQVLTWYYSGPAPVEFVYDVWVQDGAGLPARVDAWAAHRRSLWLCVSRPWLQDPQGRLKALLDARFRAAQKWEFSGVSVTRYAVESLPGPGEGR